MRYMPLMQLSKFSDYALRVLIHLAATEGQSLTTRDIAEMHDASYNHLAKVTGWLVNEGYAKATRGRGGGLSLALSAEQINLGRVLRTLEKDKPMVECMSEGGGSCRFAPACGLSFALVEAQEAFFATMDLYSLADLTELSPGMRNLLKQLHPTEKAS